MKSSLKAILIFNYFVLALCLFPFFSFGDDQVPVTPDGNGSVLGNSGAFSYSIPIDVPPGVHNLIPKVAFTYNSMSHNSYLGNGWDIPIPYVIRSTKHGVNYNCDPNKEICFAVMFNNTVSEMTTRGDWCPTCFGARIEGSFVQFKLTTDANGTYWQAIDKAGTVYSFGKTAHSRLDNPSNPSQIYKWGIETVTDANNNTISYSYFKDYVDSAPIGCDGITPNCGDLYISQIHYGTLLVNPYDGTNIAFLPNGGGRADQSVSYVSGFPVLTRYLLNQVAITSGGTKIKTYQLNYFDGFTPSNPMGRSVLTSITTLGSDGVSTLPVMTFGWNSFSGGGLGTTYSTTGITDWGDVNGRVWLDFDGDGKADFCRVTGTTTATYAVQCTLSTGTGFGNPVSSVVGIDPGQTTGRAWTDVNGDGKADFCRISTAGPYYPLCLLGGNTGFGTTYSSNSSIDPGNTDGRAWVDFDGDGKPDLCRVTGAGPYYLTCTLNDGTGFNGATISSSSSGITVNAPTATTSFWVDINGDKKADYCQISGTNPTSTVQCFVSTGIGFNSSFQVTGLDAGFDKARFWVDYNGDGLLDFCRLDSNYPYSVECTVSAGNGFGPNYYVTNSTPIGATLSLFFGDINGDGKADFCSINTSQILSCILSNGGLGYAGSFTSTVNISTTTPPIYQWADFNGDGVADFCLLTGSTNNLDSKIQCTVAGWSIGDLLSSVSNGIGKNMSIAYQDTSSFWSSTDTSWNLPFTFKVVSSITSCDNYTNSICNGNSNALNFRYAGAYYDRSNKEFRGFHTVIENNQGSGTTSTTYYETGNPNGVIAGGAWPSLTDPGVKGLWYMKGLPYLNIVQDKNLLARSAKAFTYSSDANNATGPWYYTPLNQEDTINCDTQSCQGFGLNCASPHCIQSSRIFSYDNFAAKNYTGVFGNLIEEDIKGDITNPNFDRKIRYAYTVSPNSLNLTLASYGLTASKSIFPAISSNSFISSTVYHYDLRGNLIQLGQWYDQGGPGTGCDNMAAIGTCLFTNMTPDIYGNIIAQTDPNNHTTTYCFDSYGIFPQRITNALNQSHLNDYYQVGWKTCGSSPAPFSGTGTVGEIKSVTDSNGNQSTFQYDTFGRKLMVRSPDGGTKTFSYNSYGQVGLQNFKVTTATNLTSITYFDGFGRPIAEMTSGTGSNLVRTDFQYNSLGQLVKKSLPYFDSGATPNGKVTTSAYTYSYDVIGRTTQITAPDNSNTLYCYSLMSTAIIDPDGHMKRETKDVNGNVVQVDEFSGQYSNTVCPASYPVSYATTKYNFDFLGNLLTVTDAKGNVTRMQYDSLSRKLNMRDPDMGYWTYQYDNIGNLTKQVDASGNVLVMTYDPLNRIKTKSGSFIGVIPPTAPSSLTATAKNNVQIYLSWTASSSSSGVIAYDIERCQGAGCSTFTYVGTTSSVSFADSNLISGISYTYRVQATDFAGNLSPYSNLATAMTLSVTPPTIPLNLVASSLNDSQIGLSWSGSTSSLGISGYSIEKCEGFNCNSFVPVVFVTTTSYTESGLLANTSYSYRVKALDASGNPSGYSNIATAATKANLIKLALGSVHTCEIKENQTVQCWGFNGDGELGNGTTVNSLVPLPVPGLSGVISIAAGLSHTCVVVTGGTVECWGFNFYGQLGNGTTTTALVPTPVPGITSAIAIAAGFNTTCALLSGGTIVCWGDNGLGEFGNGTTTSSSIPTRVSGISSAMFLAMGPQQTCAILSGGGISCWGSGYFGDGNPSGSRTSLVPVTVPGISSAQIVATGNGTVCTMVSGGTIYCWGGNSDGELGIGSTYYQSLVPVQVQGLLGTPVSLTTSNSGRHFCVLLNSGGIQCWGLGFYGELGNGANTTANPVPVGVIGITNAIYVAAGYDQTCAVLSGSIVECWGFGDWGQLGNGTTNRANVPTLLFFLNPPGNLSIGVSSSSQINLFWQTATGNLGISGYKVERCSGVSCTTFLQIGSITTTSYSDTTVAMGTSYTYRVRAFDTAGNLSGYTNSITTTPPDTIPPTTPLSLTASAISSNKVNLSWTASTDNVGVVGYLIDRCSGAGCTAFAHIGDSTTNSYSDLTLTALSNVSYRVRAIDAALNLSGFSNTASTMTPANLPAVTTGSAYNISSSGVSLNGSVNPNGVTATAWFEYGLTNTYGTSTTTQNLAAGTTAVTVNAAITGLSTNTTYHFRIDATSTGGTSYGLDGTFTTLANPPTVTTGTAGTITATGATLNGSVNPNGVPATAWFEYGLTNTYGASTAAQSLAAGTTAVAVNAAITGLTANTTYHFRIDASNNGGTSNGIDSTFITLASTTGSTTLFSDNFASGTATQWTPISGIWTAGALSYTQSDTTLTQTMTTAGGNWANLSIQADVKINTSGGNDIERVVFQYIDINNWSSVYISNFYGVAGIDQWVNGVETWNEIPFTPAIGTTYTLKAVANGGQAWFYINGVLKNSLTLSNAVASGSIGLSTSFANVSFANILVQTLDSTSIPTTPVNLTASAVSSSQINLTWGASADNAGIAAYLIERCQGTGCTTFSQVGSSLTTNYSDTNLTATTSYSYRVKATNVVGNASGYSNVASATTMNPPVTLFTDNFASGTATQWTPRSGTWTASALSYNQSDTTLNQTMTTAGGNWANIVIQGDVRLNTSGGNDMERIVFRYIDPNNWSSVYISLSYGIAGIDQWVNGVETFSDVAFTPLTGTWYTLKALVSGGQVYFYINGTLKNSWTLPNAATSGSIGLSTDQANADFTNITVTTP